MLGRFALTIAAFALLVPSLTMAGGHANIKVAELPKSIVAGQPVTVTFTVHDAAGRPLAKLKPVLIATRGDQRVEVQARSAKRAGSYQAAVSIPGDGEWTLTVDSRYCGNTCVLRGVNVLAAATQ